LDNFWSIECFWGAILLSPFLVFPKKYFFSDCIVSGQMNMLEKFEKMLSANKFTQIKTERSESNARPDRDPDAV
jgi:hypothetical protein